MLAGASAVPALAERDEPKDSWVEASVSPEHVTMRRAQLPKDRISVRSNETSGFLEYELPQSHVPLDDLMGAHDSVSVMVRFAGEEDFANQVNVPGTQTSGQNLVKQYEEISRYFTEQSLGQMTMKHTVLPAEDASLELSHTRQYYEPKTSQNPQGYEPYMRYVAVENEHGDITGYRGIYESVCEHQGTDVADHLSSEGDITTICPHMNVKFVQSGDETKLMCSYVADPPQDGLYYDENDKLISKDVVSDQAVIRKNACIGEIMAYVNAHYTSEGKASVYNTTICVKGGTDQLPALFQTEQGDYEGYGQTSTDAMNYWDTKMDYSYNLDEWNELYNAYSEDFAHCKASTFSYYSESASPRYTLIADEGEQDIITTEDGYAIPNATKLCRAYARTLGFSDSNSPKMGGWSLFSNTADMPVS